MSLIDSNWSENCVMMVTNVEAQTTTSSITDAKLYFPVVILSTQDNTKLLEELKSGFKRKISSNKYEPKISAEWINQYLAFLM